MDEDNPLMQIETKDGRVTSIKYVKDVEMAAIVEEFVGWWELNREGSVNRTYDYVDKIVKRMRETLQKGEVK
jgi:hypothetical protein